MGDRRVQLGAEKRVIAYRIQAVYAGASSMLPCLMQSMISGKTLSSSGGGGDFLSPEEFEALKGREVKDLIREVSERPAPKIVDVVISIAHPSHYQDVLAGLKLQGFSLKGTITLGTACLIKGEMFDTYLDDARRVNDVTAIMLAEDFNF